MPTATISGTTWAGVSAAPGATRLSIHALDVPHTRGAFLAAETTLLAIALLQAIYGAGDSGGLVLIACCAVFFHVNDVDRTIAVSNWGEFAINVTGSVLVGSATAGLLSLAFPWLHLRPRTAAVAALSAGLLPVVLRPVLGHLLRQHKLVRRTLIAGTGELAGKLYRAVADIRKGSSSKSLVTMADRRVAIDFSQIDEIVTQERASRVIVAEQDSRTKTALAEALLAPKLRGLEVSDAVEFYEERAGKIWLEAINREWFVYTRGFERSLVSLRLERAFDIVFSLALIALTAPLLALISIAIRIDSPGPVLFRQKRVGLLGETFDIFKFRSMRVDAERTTGPVWTSEQDDRVTMVGRFLRKFRLDELLQAFNVLRGDMSVVGPRPERPCFVEPLEQQIPFYSLRHYVKPGITGWAQVKYPYGRSVEDAYEKLQYDLYYVKHKSFGYDVWILLMTIKVVSFGGGQ